MGQSPQSGWSTAALNKQQEILRGLQTLKTRHGLLHCQMNGKLGMREWCRPKHCNGQCRQAGAQLAGWGTGGHQTRWPASPAVHPVTLQQGFCIHIRTCFCRHLRMPALFKSTAALVQPHSRGNAHSDNTSIHSSGGSQQ